MHHGRTSGRIKKSPQVADLTGGFGKGKGLRDLIGKALAAAQGNQAEDAELTGQALPALLYEFPQLPEEATAADARPEDLIAVVGFGEIGPFGNARVRWAAENAIALSSEAALELAWLCGCVKFESGEWVDAESGDVVDVNDLVETYELADRIGIRENQVFDPSRVPAYTGGHLSEDVVFHVPDVAIAESFRHFDPEHTEVFHDEDGCRVLRQAGRRIRVPRANPIDRNIAGQLPEGFDATRLGFDTQELDQIDPVAIYNLLATADAFRCAGLQPKNSGRLSIPLESPVHR